MGGRGGRVKWDTCRTLARVRYYLSKSIYLGRGVLFLGKSARAPVRLVFTLPASSRSSSAWPPIAPFLVDVLVVRLVARSGFPGVLIVMDVVEFLRAATEILYCKKH